MFELKSSDSRPVLALCNSIFDLESLGHFFLIWVLEPVIYIPEPSEQNLGFKLAGLLTLECKRSGFEYKIHIAQTPTKTHIPILLSFLVDIELGGLRFGLFLLNLRRGYGHWLTLRSSGTSFLTTLLQELTVLKFAFQWSSC